MGGKGKDKTKVKFKMPKGFAAFASALRGGGGGGGGDGGGGENGPARSTESVATNEPSTEQATPCEPEKQNASTQPKAVEKPQKAAKLSRAEKNKLKEFPPYGSRVKTAEMAMKAKAEVLKEYPGLEMERPQAGDRGAQAVMCGANSVRAEIIDLNSMVKVMSDNVTTLTHEAVEQFFDWFPIFLTYLERYMTVEEEFIIRPIEEKVDGLRGDLKPSGRMLLRGRIQRALTDLVELQDIFKPYLPAGQRLPQVVAACQLFTDVSIQYWTTVTRTLPLLINKHMNKTESEKLRTRLVKHVVNHVGYKDFLAIYTRWMGAAELWEWKANVLLPCDYKFFSYAQWDREIDEEHYYIAANFGEILDEENREHARQAEENKADFERAQAQRAQMEEEMTTDEYYDEDFETSTEGGETPRSVSHSMRTPRSHNRTGETPRSRGGGMMNLLTPKTPKSTQARTPKSSPPKTPKSSKSPGSP